MKRPAIRTMVLGHPVIATPIMLAGMIGFFASLFGGAGALPAMVCLGIALSAAGANSQANAYSEWKIAWDSMAEPAARRTGQVKSVVRGIIALALVYCVLNMPHGLALAAAGDAGYTVGTAQRLAHQPLAWVAIVALCIAIRWLRRRPRRLAKPFAVKVVAKTIVPVQPLVAAYAALPDYCQALLKGAQA